MTRAYVRRGATYFVRCDACGDETGPYQERAAAARAMRRHNSTLHPRSPPPPEKRRTTADPRVRCPRCRSADVVKAGLRPCRNGINQLYRCGCGRKFSGDDDRFRRKFPRWVRSRALDLRKRGTSCRRVAARLKAEFGVDVGKSSVVRWERTGG